MFAELFGATRLSVKLAESHAHALAIDGAEPTGYGLGRAGWVMVPFARQASRSPCCATGSRRAFASSRRSGSWQSWMRRVLATISALINETIASISARSEATAARRRAPRRAPRRARAASASA